MFTLISNFININVIYFIGSSFVVYKNIFKSVWVDFIFKTDFIYLYFLRNENIWQDGFLFDFLQKKTLDTWLRRFVIYTGFLFSERLFFDLVIRLYLDNILWSFHKFSIFETSNFFELFLILLFFYLTLFFILFSIFIFL